MFDGVSSSSGDHRGRREGRPVREVAAAYGVHRGWIYRLLARYRVEGEAAFEPRSRRPRSSPSATPAEIVDLVVRLRKQLTERGLAAGPHTIVWHLTEHHRVRLSPATVWRILSRTGHVIPEPKKRPKASYQRFAAELPNQLWQTDFTHWQLTGQRGVEILNILDDHSRYLLAATAHRRITGPIVVTAFEHAFAAYGAPASVLSYNGMVFTTRFAGGRGGRHSRNGLETLLANLGVQQKNSAPNHPQTCGKVERLHQTQKRWLARQPAASTLADLQALLDRFRDEYNTARPHRSLGRRTPAAAYTARPKATPTASPKPATIGSAATASTTPVWSPCATTAACTTSASDEPTPEPTSCCSSRTCTSE
jgi:transposase InsO family protein